MEALNKFVNQYNLFVKGDTEEVHPKALQSIIKAIQGKKEEKAQKSEIRQSGAVNRAAAEKYKSSVWSRFRPYGRFILLRA